MRTELVPEREILFAAKTGFLTKKLWDAHFANGTYSWRQKQWSYLVGRGYFKKHPSSRAIDVVILDRKNPDVRRLVGDQITSPPYLNQLDHDELVADFILRLSDVITNFRTEGEQKRFRLGQHNRLDMDYRDKYADALIQLKAPEKKMTLALELELTTKCQKRYRRIFNTYAAVKNIDRVIFITRTESQAESIRQAIVDAYYPLSVRPIGFSSLDSWKSDPKTAAIIFHDTLTTIAKLSGLTDAVDLSAAS
jgi:hypothetical protein